MKLEDIKLVENFLAGDDGSFEILVKKYLKPVFNFLFQITSDRDTLDDLTQITFIKVWKNIKKFDETKNFKVWLFTIAKNTAFDHIKKKKTIPFSFFETDDGYNKLDEISEDSILPDKILEKKDLAKDLEEKLKKLSELYRIILLMHYKDDFSLSEIAEILDKPYNTIKSQHQRGLKVLKEKFFEN